MIKMLTAHTEEIDDVTAAVGDILRQLDLPRNMLTHAVGILTCYSEFLDTGVVKALKDALPFDVVGCTTLGNGISGHNGMLSLCLSVLTSDDVSFSCIQTEPISGSDLSSIGTAYKKACAFSDEKPGLILCFLPLIMELGGELMMDELDAKADGIPVFGTIACDHHANYVTAATIFNGESSKDRMSMVLLYGNVHPRFERVAISDKKLQKQRAVITKSQKSLLMGVNGLTAMDYMKTLGLTKGDGIEGMSAIPFLVDYNDGTPAAARAMYLVTGEGNIVCGGAMPEGATLAIGSIDYDEVLSTSESVISQINALEDKSCMLLFSCLSRCSVLGTSYLDELDKIADTIDADLPYHVCYSGGELCPACGDNGIIQNRFHNFTIIACIL